MADRLLCLDVGEKRIGVAVADLGVKIAIPLTTIEVDGTEIEQILRLYGRENARTLVVGYPRNQQGETTAQTVFVEEFVKPLEEYTNSEIKDRVKGKRFGDIQADLQSIEGVRDVSVELSPFWVSTIPNDTSKITIKFNIDTTGR